MKKKIIIYLEDLTASQEVLLQKLLQSFCVEQIEVLEDTTSTLLVGDLQIDVERRQVWRAGNLIELTSMEFDILYLLAHHPGQVFSARQIYEAVAADSFDASWTGISQHGLQTPAQAGCRYHRNSAGPRLQIRCPRHITKIK